MILSEVVQTVTLPVPGKEDRLTYDVNTILYLSMKLLNYICSDSTGNYLGPKYKVTYGKLKSKNLLLTSKGNFKYEKNCIKHDIDYCPCCGQKV